MNAFDLPRRVATCLVLLGAAIASARADSPDVLPGTKRLEREGDVASQLIDACDAFLLRQLEASIPERPDRWEFYNDPPETWKPALESLRRSFGVADNRVPCDGIEFVASTESNGVVANFEADGARREIRRVRWPVFEGVWGEGLLIDGGVANGPVAIVLPDADQFPEELLGLDAQGPAADSLPLRLARSGVTVFVPSLISRDREKRRGRANLTHREYLHRSAFVLGRTLTGYEIQKTLALVDWATSRAAGDVDPRIAVAGYGEGGLIAMYAAAIDDRIDATLVSGAFGNRQAMWNEPLDRMAFDVLGQAGDAELAWRIHPRRLVVEASRGPELTLTGEGGAPATLASPTKEQVAAEIARYRKIARIEPDSPDSAVIAVGLDHDVAFGSPAATEALCETLGVERSDDRDAPLLAVADSAWRDHAARRLARQVAELDAFNQRTLESCEFERAKFMESLDTSSPERYDATAAEYRAKFSQRVIGEYDLPLEPFEAQSRKAWETDKWTGYEVTLNVFDGVFAYGALLLPKDLADGERRPVVVCQHGLEGRPTDTFQGDHPAYHDFAGKLAERGFIVFCPQNIYIFEDRFRTLQRKSLPLGKTLFSIMVPQHRQIVNWLRTLPNVDGERIGFYGLSYGGKSAMRIPAIVTDYRLSICSADFNEWVRKNASTKHDFSYVWTGEYEIFEFDLGRTFNYAEMAALIAPRPFMVERGHFDGVGVDEWVAYEYAKVRRLYAAQLKIPERTEIEFFVGPHTIHGQRSFAFLHEHLDWPTPEERAATP